jgi:hypothetical protein
MGCNCKNSGTGAKSEASLECLRKKGDKKETRERIYFLLDKLSDNDLI